MHYSLFSFIDNLGENYICDLNNLLGGEILELLEVIRNGGTSNISKPTPVSDIESHDKFS